LRSGGMRSVSVFRMTPEKTVGESCRRALIDFTFCQYIGNVAF
jgi:hypothetical protein